MKLRQIVSPTFSAAKKVGGAVWRFSILERVLAFVCVVTPALLIYFDGCHIRDSISDYYNMQKNNQIFYVPLTVASMLFLVNGIIKNKHYYNTILGIMLAGVILFNNHDFVTIHDISALGFFVGNAVVIVVYSSKKELWFKLLLVAGMAVTLMGFFIHWYTLFWVEWISFSIIALHYILESWGVIK